MRKEPIHKPNSENGIGYPCNISGIMFSLRMGLLKTRIEAKIPALEEIAVIRHHQYVCLN